MIKKLIAIFFLALFVSQALPIKQVGSVLYGYDITDELPESEPSKTVLDGKYFLSVNDHVCSNSGLNTHSAFYIHFSEILPACYHGEVQTPPPDQLA